ncbi:MAG: preprotein translocase subunit YajC [Acidimicrobiales bacterium]
MLNSALTASYHLMAAAPHSTKASTSSSGTLIYLLFMGLIVYVGWRLIFRPQSQRAKQQRQTISLLSVGDEVMTTSGIFGTILDIDGDKVHLQVSDGCVLTMVRSAIGQRLSSSADGSALGGRDWQDGDGTPEEEYDEDGDAVADGDEGSDGSGRSARDGAEDDASIVEDSEGQQH